jgi:hypothetical protein
MRSALDRRRANFAKKIERAERQRVLKEQTEEEESM